MNRLQDLRARFLDAQLRGDRRLAARVIALSATMSFHAAALRAAVRAVRDRFGAQLPLAAGGGAIAWTPSLVAELGVEIAAPSAEEMVAATARLLGLSAGGVRRSDREHVERVPRGARELRRA